MGTITLGDLSYIAKEVFNKQYLKKISKESKSILQLMKEMKYIYAIDFDGIIVSDRFPKIGKPNLKIIKFIKKLNKEGHFIILWTCRNGKALKEAIKFCKKYKIKLDAVNKNLSFIQKKYNSDTRKVYADYYLDDKSLNISEVL